MGFKLGAGWSEALALQMGESSTGAEMSADSVLIGSQGSSLPVNDPWAGFARVGRWELGPSQGLKPFLYALSALSLVSKLCVGWNDPANSAEMGSHGPLLLGIRRGEEE